MAQCRRVEGQIELKCEAHKFFNVWTQQTDRVPEMIPHKISKIELNEGAHWHSPGAVKTWYYVIGKDCRQETGTTKVAKIDKKSYTVHYIHIDGYVLKEYYRSFETKLQAIPKGEKGCIVKWSLEYEKKSEDAPDAEAYIDLLLDCSKDIDAHLCTA